MLDGSEDIWMSIASFRSLSSKAEVLAQDEVILKRVQWILSGESKRQV